MIQDHPGGTDITISLDMVVTMGVIGPSMDEEEAEVHERVTVENLKEDKGEVNKAIPI